MAGLSGEQGHDSVEVPLAQLRHLFQGGDPRGITNYLTVPVEGRLMAVGTSVPLLVNQFGTTSTGLLAPHTAGLPHLSDYMGVFVTISDYFPPARKPTKAQMTGFIRTLTEAHTIESVLTALLIVRKALDRPDDIDDLEHNYLDALQDETRIYLTNQIISTSDRKRVFVSRHGILASIRHLILEINPDGSNDDPNIVSSIMVIHTISDLLYDSYRDDQQSRAPGTSSPTPLEMEIFQNQLFYRFDGVLELLSRTYVLWRCYSRHITRTPISYDINDMLVIATGLDLLDWLVYGYYLAIINQETSITEIWFSREDLPFANEGLAEQFLSLVSKDIAGFRELLSRSVYRWSYESFEDYPLVKHDDLYAVIDSRLLIERATKGLYWYIHDYVRTNCKDVELTRWSQAYAEMIECYAIDLVLEMAPHGLGDAEVVYFEDRLSSQYDCKVCEIVIDFGEIFCAVEVVSGRVKRPTRFGGDIGTFDTDTEQLVMKKLRQLHEISLALINQESVLTKAPPVANRTIVPILVTDYPMNPFVKLDLQTRTTNEGLLGDKRIAPLSIIDLGELEQLESVLSSGGPDLPTFLRAWHDSSLVGGPLMTYVDSRYGSGEKRKTFSMRKVDINEVAKGRLAEA